MWPTAQQNTRFLLKRCERSNSDGTLYFKKNFTSHPSVAGGIVVGVCHPAPGREHYRFIKEIKTALNFDILSDNDMLEICRQTDFVFEE